MPLHRETTDAEVPTGVAVEAAVAAEGLLVVMVVVEVGSVVGDQVPLAVHALLLLGVLAGQDHREVLVADEALYPVEGATLPDLVRRQVVEVVEEDATVDPVQTRIDQYTQCNHGYSYPPLWVLFFAIDKLLLLGLKQTILARSTNYEYIDHLCFIPLL